MEEIHSIKLKEDFPHSGRNLTMILISLYDSVATKVDYLLMMLN